VAALRDDLAIELAAAQLKLRKRDMLGTLALINSSAPHHRVSTLDSFLNESSFAGTVHVFVQQHSVSQLSLYWLLYLLRSCFALPQAARKAKTSCSNIPFHRFAHMSYRLTLFTVSASALLAGLLIALALLAALLAALLLCSSSRIYRVTLLA
jgi:hypothetical protein